jgi:probable F420-dependent oxidoreductase
MKIGVVFPQTEFGHDPVALRDYAQTAEALGYSHVLAYDHVLGADTRGREPWPGPYTYRDAFQEPFVLFSFIAAWTERIGLTTGILILPQRQTALVAKQAATLDALSGGRLRLGVGLGWNSVEYEALGQDFHRRGRRIEEQVQALRALWTQPVVTLTGRWERLERVGLNPLPVQRPIPVWFGGHADAVLRRAARLGDGWMPNHRTAADAAPSLAKLRGYLQAEGRSAEGFGIEARLHYQDGDAARWRRELDEWAAARVTHASLNTMRSGLDSAADHIAAVGRFAEAIGLDYS